MLMVKIQAKILLMYVDSQFPLFFPALIIYELGLEIN